MKTTQLIRQSRVLSLAACAAFFYPAATSVSAHEDAAPAHVPAASVHDHTAMKTASEAWASINSIRAELAEKIEGKNLKTVHETAEQLTTALRMLPEVSKDLSADKLKRVQGAVANLAKALDTAHNAADEKDQAGTEKQLKTIDSLLKVLASQYPAAVATAKPAKAAHEGHDMPMHMGAHGEPTVQVAFVPSAPPTAGADVPIVVKLTTKDGKPVTSADLDMAHTKLVHLLIVDASLTSYLHEHPVETAPGEWTFTFKPKTGGTYTVFADLLPKATGAQEYAKTTFTVAGEARTLDLSTNLTTTVEGYRFDLKIPTNEPLTAGEASLVSVHVTKPDGSPATNLEPVMAAFAHGVGFTADLHSVMHVHPMGKEPEADHERGGPDLSFHLQPAQAGFFKFYVQVQIDGQSKFAPFGLEAAAGKPKSEEHHHEGAGSSTYACPMHPTVTSTNPADKCPKCGMSLKAMKH